MTIYDFIKKYDGKTIGFPAGSYVGECLSLVKVWIQEKYGFYPPASGCNGARCYWSVFPQPLDKYFDKIPNTPDFIPENEDIMIWTGDAGGGAGHISLVIRDADHPADKNYFWSFDQNWGGRQAHLVKHNYQNVFGVLRPKKENNMGDEYGNMVKKSTQWDETVKEYLPGRKPEDVLFDDLRRVVSGYKGRITALEGDRDNLQVELNKARTEVQNQKDKLANVMAECQKTNELLLTELKAKNETIKSFEATKGSYTATIEEQRESIRACQKAGGEKDVEITGLKTKLEQCQQSHNSESDVVGAMEKLIQWIKQIWNKQ